MEGEKSLIGVSIGCFWVCKLGLKLNGKMWREVIWLLGGPIVIISIFLMYTGPMFLDASSPRTHVAAVGLPRDVELGITLEPFINDLDTNYFLLPCTMKMGIKQNSTRTLDYNIVVTPEPIASGSYATAVSIPFANLQHTGHYDSLDLISKEWSAFEEYSYSLNLSSAYTFRTTQRFPGDFYWSSMICVWFNAPMYPEIELSPTLTLPRGFIAVLTRPFFVKPQYFYENMIHPFDRLFIGMPSNDVMVFQIEVLRDTSSIVLYSFYIVTILYASYEVLALSRLRTKKLEDRLNVFVGVAIASVAFLWSVRQVTNVISWYEMILLAVLGAWISLEVKEDLESKKTHSSTKLEQKR